MKRLEELAYSTFLKAQKIYRLIMSDIFVRAYNYSSDKQKKDIENCILKCDSNTLSALIYDLGTKRLVDKPITELRKMGRHYRVKYYNTIPKAHLIEGIEDAINARG